MTLDGGRKFFSRCTFVFLLPCLRYAAQGKVRAGKGRLFRVTPSSWFGLFCFAKGHRINFYSEWRFSTNGWVCLWETMASVPLFDQAPRESRRNYGEYVATVSDPLLLVSVMTPPPHIASLPPLFSECTARRATLGVNDVFFLLEGGGGAEDGIGVPCMPVERT